VNRTSRSLIRKAAGAARDCFWKAGSGGHALYVVPSLDLVVWNLEVGNWN
jgi:hypothetical protein